MEVWTYTWRQSNVRAGFFGFSIMAESTLVFLGLFVCLVIPVASVSVTFGRRKHFDTYIIWLKRKKGAVTQQYRNKAI